MKSTISESSLPVLTVDLEPGESVVSETGEFSWKTPSIEMNTTTNIAGTSGILSALTRSMLGVSSMFMTEYKSVYEPGHIAFAARVPGSIIREEVNPNHSYIIHKHGFLACTPGIRLGTSFQSSLGSGLFGGNGFFMQKVSGVGFVWVELGGQVIVKDLAKGESLDVHPGHVGMFDSTVNLNVVTVPGLKNKLFGGNGLFMARLTGPGRVWLQTLTLANLAHALSPYFKSPD